MVNIVIIGAGHGCRALLDLFTGSDDVKIVGVAGRSDDAVGMVHAKELGIPTTLDLLEFVRDEKVDLIIDATGNSEVNEVIRDNKPREAGVMTGLSAKMMWDLVEERQKREADADRALKDQHALYKIGLLLTSTSDLDEVLDTILKNALKLTETPAGSIALYGKNRSSLQIRAALGFSPSFVSVQKWRVRPGGLTARILGSTEPTVLEDAQKDPAFDNPILLKEGVMSLIAVPLVSQDVIQGILYVDDFGCRQFTRREVNLLTLFANQATLAIERAQILETVRRQAVTDGLTNVYNHRYFQERLETEISRARRHGQPLSLLMLDVDQFKPYNDSHGHLKGDRALKRAAAILKKTTRRMDVISRYGGEEFAVVLPETGSEEALVVADRIRRTIEEHPFPGKKGEKEQLTVSVGVALYPKDAQSRLALVDKADEALYQAKKSGGNQVAGVSEPGSRLNHQRAAGRCKG